MRPIFLAVFLVVVCATNAAAGPLEEAYSAYQRGDYAQVARLYRPLAEQGDAQAQSKRGLLYDVGTKARRRTSFTLTCGSTSRQQR